MYCFLFIVLPCFCIVEGLGVLEVNKISDCRRQCGSLNSLSCSNRNKGKFQTLYRYFVFRVAMLCCRARILLYFVGSYCLHVHVTINKFLEEEKLYIRNTKIFVNCVCLVSTRLQNLSRQEKRTAMLSLLATYTRPDSPVCCLFLGITSAFLIFYANKSLFTQ